MWINLPREMKSCPPRNQVLRAHSTPLIREGGAELRLLVGQYGSHQSPITSGTPVLMMDVHVAPNAAIDLKLPGEFFAGVYVLDGEGRLGAQPLQPFSVATTRPTAAGETTLGCQAGPRGLRFLLYAGRLLEGSLDVDGYFTCCSAEETTKALSDFEARTGDFALGKDWCASIVKL